MFTHLRQSAQGFFARLILFALVAMFVVWGIGDVFRTMGTTTTDVATVGKKPVSVQEFRAALERTHGQQQAQVLSGLVNDSLIDQEAAALGIRVNDDTVADVIANLPEFKGKDGQFDKALYQQMLSMSNTTERRFIEDVRREIAAKLLIGSFTGGVQVPDAAVKALFRIEQEKRSADLVLVSASSDAARVAPTASDAEIKAYYDAHSRDFLVPEMRSISYVTLPLADVVAKIQVSDDEVKRAYDEHVQDFQRPERRQMEQMVFQDEAAAKKASGQLAKGGDFNTIAKSADIINKGKLTMGDLSEQELPAEAAGAGVFKLGAGQNSAPVQSDFGWHIFHVVKVMPGGQMTLADAKPDIIRDISTREAQDTITKMMNGFEDALAGGATLEKAADGIGQKVKTAGPLTKEGMTADGKKADLPPYEGFLGVVFTTAEKDRSRAVPATDGSYFLVRVDSVAPEHARPLAEVKDEVSKLVLKDKENKKLEKSANAISEKLRAGKKLNEAEKAAEQGLQNIPSAASGALSPSTETVPEGKLKGTALPRGLLSELFRVSPGQSTHAYPLGDGSFMIATLSGITPAPDKVDPKIADQLRDDLKTTYTDDILHQYLVYLRGKYPVSINGAALNMKDEAGSE